jgi:hypothetical protein
MLIRDESFRLRTHVRSHGGRGPLVVELHSS